MPLRDNIEKLERSLGHLEQMMAQAIEIEQDGETDDPKGSVEDRLTAIEATLERIATGFAVVMPPLPEDPAPATPSVMESLARLQGSLQQLQLASQPRERARLAKRS